MNSLSARLVTPLFVLALVGCHTLRPGGTGGLSPRAREAASIETLIASHNRNASRLDSIKCRKVEIDGKAEGQPITMTGRMAFQQPFGFRLSGEFMSKPEVELGSNESEIFFWFRRMQPPALFYCKRTDLSGVQLAAGFDPDWLVELIGARTIEPDKWKTQTITTHPKHVFLKTQTTTPQGRAVAKRIRIQRDTGRIDGFEVFDLEGAAPKPIAEAAVVDFYDDPSSGVYIPRSIRIQWASPDEYLSINLSRNHTEVNTLSPELAKTLFSKGEFDSDIEVVDLKRMNDEVVARRAEASGYRPEVPGGARRYADESTNSPAKLNPGIQPVTGADATSGAYQQ